MRQGLRWGGIVEPFIGICCNQDDLARTRLLQHPLKNLPGAEAFMMLGIKGAQPIGGLYNLPDALRPFIHCDYNSKEPFAQTVKRNLHLNRAYARGLQFNILPWMDTDFSPLWSELKRRHPDLLLSLQVPRVMMETFAPEQIARRLRHQQVDYVMFDPSQSRGIPFDVPTMRRYVEAVHREDLPIGIVVSGGLSGLQMEPLFEPLATLYPNLSCDAFGGLRDIYTGLISLPKVNNYLMAWHRFSNIRPAGKPLVAARGAANSV